MSSFNVRSTALTVVASFLMKLLEQTPEWQGPTKTEFDLRLRELIEKLEDAEVRIDLVYVAEAVVETAAEVALL